MEMLNFSEMVVKFYKIMWDHIPKDSSFHTSLYSLVINLLSNSKGGVYLGMKFLMTLPWGLIDFLE
jgi:hypothetical protein